MDFEVEGVRPRIRSTKSDYRKRLSDPTNMQGICYRP